MNETLGPYSSNEEFISENNQDEPRDVSIKNSSHRDFFKTSREKKINDLNAQMREVVDFLGAYLFKKDEYDGDSELDLRALQKFSEEDLKEFLEKMSFIKDWRFNTTEEFDQFRSAQPEKFWDVFVSLLRACRSVEKKLIDNMFLDALRGRSIDQELKQDLDSLTINLESNFSQNQIQSLRRNLPSGNFLLHTTHLESALGAIQSNALLSSEEISRARRRVFGFGGGAGISFNMNSVRILTGSPRHFVGFLLSPETALEQNPDCALTVPPFGAEYEVALVPADLKDKKRAPDFWNASKDVRVESLPEISVDQTYLFCSRSDLENFKAVLAAYHIRPKGLLSYSQRSLRVESWTDYSNPGDHEIAANMLSNLLSKSDVRPTLDWRKDLFPESPMIEVDGRVHNEDIQKSFSIVKTAKGLEVES